MKKPQRSIFGATSTAAASTSPGWRSRSRSRTSHETIEVRGLVGIVTAHGASVSDSQRAELEWRV